MNYTLDQALRDFKAEVKIKYPPGAVATNRVKEMDKGRGRGRYGGRGPRRYGGRCRGSGRLGRGRGRGYIPKLGSKVITLINGNKIYYHEYIKFSDNIYHQMTNYQQESPHTERKEYQDKQGNNYGGGKQSMEHMQI